MPEVSNKPLTTTRVAALLMLCPLLAVSDSVINALGLGLVAVVVSAVASLPLAVALQRLPEYGRIATVVAIVAAVVTCALLVINAYFHDLYLAIGAYLPLLVASGLLLARHEVALNDPRMTEPSSREPAPYAGQPANQRSRPSSLVIGGLRTGAVFAAVLLLLGAVRELTAHGTLLFGAQALPVDGAEKLTWTLFHPDFGFVLAALPPGAFIAMGILFAIRNWIRQRRGKQ